MKPEGFMNPIPVPVKININHGPMTPRSQNIDNNILASVSGKSSFIDEEPVREPMTRIPESSNQRELYNFAKYQQSSDMKNKNLQLSLNDELPVPAYRSEYSAEVLLQKHEDFVVKKVKIDHYQPERSDRIALKRVPDNFLDDSEMDTLRPRAKAVLDKKAQKPKSHRSHNASMEMNKSILENAEEASTFELFTRVMTAYGHNITYTFRRLLLKLGANIDKQREAEIRRRIAATDNILNKSSARMPDIEAEVASYDSQNIVQVMIMVSLIVLILLLLFK